MKKLGFDFKKLEKWEKICKIFIEFWEIGEGGVKEEEKNIFL
jgi:hypothetical protein